MDVNPALRQKKSKRPSPVLAKLGLARDDSGAGHYDKTHASRTACGEVKHRKLRSMFERVDGLSEGIIGRPTRSCHAK